MKAIILAKWFLKNNSLLRLGFNDENVKLNKLLYFSNLMFFSLYNSNLIDEPFEKWDNGPVIPLIYREYRYEKLGSSIDEKVEINNSKIEQILKIINFVYSTKSAKQLSDETHKHSIWLEAQKNKPINFNNIAKKEKNLMLSLYDTYSDFNFDNIKLEKINGNLYYYDKTNLKMTDDIISQLDKTNNRNKTYFIELIDGELVFS